MMRRREFLAGFAAATTVGKGMAGTQSNSSASGRERKLARIAISTWSFHTLFPAMRGAPQPAGKPLDIMDFPQMMADQYGIHNLEIVMPHFGTSEPSRLREFKARMEKAHSQLINIPVDYDALWGKPGLSARDPKERKHAVALYSKWIPLAKLLGARSIRCDPGQINRADLTPTIESYKALEALGKEHGVYIIVENHGGVGSEHPEELVKILKSAGSYAGTLPDFGNFPDAVTRERGLKALFPLAPSICHVRDVEDYADGRNVPLDVRKCIQISKDAGFKGAYSIEFGDAGPDPHKGVKHIQDILLESL